VAQARAGGGRGATGKAGTAGASGASGASGARGGARRRAPRWARLCAIVGALLMLGSGGTLVAKEILLARYEGAVTKADLFGDEAAAAEQPKVELEGPLNILLVGIDPRDSEPDWVPRADSVVLLHVPEEMDRGYLFSLPRDLWVDVPAFGKTRYNGGKDKLAHAMYFGAQPTKGGRPDAARGFELLAKTVSRYTGIERFDAGAIINFTGFKKIVDAMGGVTMYLDMDVTSIHMQPNGKHRRPSGTGGEGAAAYVGPRKQYKKGTRHLKGWEALDYVRQRYIPGGDYARQRHQQQFIRAMANQALSKDVVTNPIKLDQVIRAAGKALIFNGRGHSVVDFGLALRNIGSESIVMVKLPGASIIQGGDYIGEKLQPVADEFFEAVRAGTVDAFITSHPELINTTK